MVGLAWDYQNLDSRSKLDVLGAQPLYVLQDGLGPHAVAFVATVGIVLLVENAREVKVSFGLYLNSGTVGITTVDKGDLVARVQCWLEWWHAASRNFRLGIEQRAESVRTVPVIVILIYLALGAIQATDGSIGAVHHFHETALWIIKQHMDVSACHISHCAFSVEEVKHIHIAYKFMLVKQNISSKDQWFWFLLDFLFPLGYVAITMFGEPVCDHAAVAPFPRDR